MSEPKFNQNLVRSILLGILAIGIGILIFKQFSKDDTKSEPKISFRSKSVIAEKALLSDIPILIEVSGRLKASNRLELYSEVSGILKSSNFRAGSKFSKNQTIASIDDREFRAQLKAQKSSFMGLISQILADVSLDYPNEYETWKTFLQNIDPNNSLPKIPDVTDQQFKQFISGRNILSNYYNIQSQEVRLQKHRITAPYSGVLSETSIDPGTLVRAGQKLGTFTQQGGYELEASVSKTDLAYLKIGSKVNLFSDEFNKTYQGTVSRINSIIDPGTQLVSVFLKVSGSDLHEGSYLTAKISGGTATNALKIKRSLLFDNSTYIIQEDSTLYKQPVEILNYLGEYAIIKGITSGSTVPNKAISGAFEGMKVIPITQTTP
ncbi:MAG: HlyD family efflux transporter periplasmic adaptor subunit [Bacteroidia bacterium]|nr:HlyD family efflux transporter periplasmic adaptor subunit [Bacteroidia bacterium]